MNVKWVNFSYLCTLSHKGIENNHIVFQISDFVLCSYFNIIYKHISSKTFLLFFVAAVLQFVGLGLVYNLDKKTLAKMNSELQERRAANK